jgi:hypothetical protein
VGLIEACLVEQLWLLKKSTHFQAGPTCPFLHPLAKSQECRTEGGGRRRWVGRQSYCRRGEGSSPGPLPHGGIRRISLAAHHGGIRRWPTATNRARAPILAGGGGCFCFCFRQDLLEIPFARAFEDATEATIARFLTPTAMCALDVGNERVLQRSLAGVNEFSYDVIRRFKEGQGRVVRRQAQRRQRGWSSGRRPWREVCCRGD